MYLSWLARGDKQKAGMAYEEFQKYEGEAREKVARRTFENVRIKDRRHSGWGW